MARRISRHVISLAAAALSTAVVSPTLAAQQADADSYGDYEQPRRVTFDGRAGYALPSGRLADATDPGFTFGLGASYWLSPRVALNAGGDIEFLRGEKILDSDVRGPDLDLWHYNAGAAVSLLPTNAARWELLANVGAGASTFDSEVEGSDSETRFTTNGGMRLGYRLARMADVFVGSQAYLIFTDEDLQGSKTNWTFPVHAGLKLKV